MSNITLKDDQYINGYYAVMARHAGAWTALNDVDLNRVNKVTANVAVTGETGTIELRLDSPTGQKIAEISANNTGTTSYAIEAQDASQNSEVNEFAYTTVETEISENIKGVHDLYVVFATEDIRVDSIQFEKAVVDTSALENAVEESSKLNKDDYSSGFEALEEALNNAKDVLADNGSTQAEVDEALAALQAAQEGLVLKEEPTVEPIEKDETEEPQDKEEKEEKDDKETVTTGDVASVGLFVAMASGSGLAIKVLKRKKEND